MTTTEINAVLAANAAFYRAMREADLATMRRLWCRRRLVACTHPGGPTIQGRTGVMESWRQILLGSKTLPIRCVAPHAIVTGQSAMVLCREELEGALMMASNVFVREAGAWRMLSHHAAELPRH